jgi:hypothetical protein
MYDNLNTEIRIKPKLMWKSETGVVETIQKIKKEL